jgi:hypothetical protein
VRAACRRAAPLAHQTFHMLHALETATTDDSFTMSLAIMGELL